MENGGGQKTGKSECGMRSAECGMTGSENGSCKDAAKDFDLVEARGELERMRKALKALAAGEQVEFDQGAAERDLERIRKGIEVLLARQEATRVI